MGRYTIEYITDLGRSGRVDFVGIRSDMHDIFDRWVINKFPDDHIVHYTIKSWGEP